MVVGLQKLMVGPQQGAAALRDGASRHRHTLTRCSHLSYIDHHQRYIQADPRHKDEEFSLLSSTVTNDAVD